MSGPTSPRYGLHADRYRRFRPGYPEWLFDLAAEACEQPRALAVELGAGSGQATGEILKRFRQVIAVEPDADMAARIPPDPRLEIRIEPAETVSFGRPLDAVISATAFHWMDAVSVGRKVARALRPGGVFLAFGYAPFAVTAPASAVTLFEAEMGVWAAQTDARLSAWKPYPALLAASDAFSNIEELSFGFEVALSPDDAAGLLMTTSYAAAHGRMLGDEDGYLADLARCLGEATGGGPVTVSFTATGGLARV